ncbi:hypothetical protein I7I50_01520 [Histoplasma capsulatum G186AR]|uniref:Uncharacterized protein n=1 Tax=Ajellomyces capsulatus TaxID=5037 RepID=A0A8H7YGF7_AJECA|nr:hypothetical protein I7I52_12636 [Histoplasma capsulatum]QSS73379.1 hypothetical protein I7I50_01520 [Histoplasma capsulatum G186AR]
MQMVVYYERFVENPICVSIIPSDAISHLHPRMSTIFSVVWSWINNSSSLAFRVSQLAQALCQDSSIQ